MSRLCLCLLLFLSLSTSAQIVNTESQRMQSDSGWMGNMGTSFSLTRNTQQVLNIDALAHVQHQTAKDLWLFLVNYELLKTDSETLASSMLMHLRYNHKVTKRMKWEGFVQLQKDSVIGIDFRLLIGTGPRFSLRETNQFKLYAGTSAMYEYEKETDHSTRHRNIRSSNYVSLSYVPNKILEIDNAIFYQPLYHSPKDFRLLNELHVDIKTSKHFSITTNIYYLYDAYPAYKVPHSNYDISNGLNYSF